MRHKNLALTLGAIITSCVLIFSCRKINEATTIGGELIPEVDNVKTFDTLLDVQVFNDTFSLLTDSTRYTSGYEHFLGNIGNDPFFGRTDATLSLELKPAAFPFSFANKPDSLHLDSVVLVLDYTDTYGDTTIPQTINVYEVDQSSDFRAPDAFDSAYLIRENKIVKAGLLGSKAVLPQTLKDSVKAYLDTTTRQLRIRLSDAFGQRLLAYDSVSGGAKGAYASDSAFRSFFKGFTLESVSGGNAIMGFNLGGANTKLALYYKDDNGDAPVDKWDTAVTYFSFNDASTSSAPSASAQYIKRDYAGTPLAAAAGGTTPDSRVYIQNTPGSFATIKVPGLLTLSNRVVHRAELIMEQIYDPSDAIFPPSLLYIDEYDPLIGSYTTLPYSLLFDNSGTPNLPGLGVAPIDALDDAGNVVKTWRFNMSRYVQNIVNGNENPHELRLFSPVYTYEMYKPTVLATPTKVAINVNAAAGKGRVRLHGSDPTLTNPHRMRLRIVYSRI